MAEARSASSQVDIHYVGEQEDSIYFALLKFRKSLTKRILRTWYVILNCMDGLIRNFNLLLFLPGMQLEMDCGRLQFGILG